MKEIHIHFHLKKEMCLCGAFITNKTSALLDYRDVSGFLLYTIIQCVQSVLFCDWI